MLKKYIASTFSNKEMIIARYTHGILREHQFSSISDKSDMTKMAAVSQWREAASIIVAAKCSIRELVGTNIADAFSRTSKPKNSVSRLPPKFDYRILMLKRSFLSSFMANAYVFPGGMIELSDYSLKWYDVFKNAGIGKEELDQLSNSISGPRPPMFSNSFTLSKENISITECFPPDLAVRISAIRETFEESGILLLTNSNLQSKKDVLSYSSDNINLQSWRTRVNKDPNAFLQLCLEAKMCPNVWCLHEWWNWLTPTNVGHRRFDTMFYVCCLSKMPEAQADQSEISSLKWCNPEEIIEENFAGSVFLAPPQIYELSRFLNFHHILDLHKFSKQREPKGVERWMPVICSATDGAVSFLPGDDLYPEKPDIEGITVSPEYPFAIDELRNRSHNLNRLEISGVICSVLSNVTPACNHAQPSKHPSHIPVVQSFL